MSVSGPCLFNVFLNNLDIQLDSVNILFKYADDSNIVVPLWKDRVDQSFEVTGNFLRWSENNSMSCNKKKWKELTVRKKEFKVPLLEVHYIPQCSELMILGVNDVTR